jgi:predicted transcriptional regulator
MQRIKHPPIRNKIDFSDASQVRAFTKRLRVPADELKAIIEKVGNSVAAVTKEVELRRMPQQSRAVPPVAVATPSEPVEVPAAATGLTA